jgi:hypothetical protein
MIGRRLVPGTIEHVASAADPYVVAGIDLRVFVAGWLSCLQAGDGEAVGLLEHENRPGRLAASAGAGESLGGLVHRGKAGFDVALDAAQGLVPGLGHDDVGGDVGLAEVGGRGVAELVQLQAVAVPAEQ